MKASALAIVLILPYTWGTSIPRTYYVSPTGSATYPFSTPETAATVIQDAVDAAQYGDVVQLMPGEYGQTVELKDGMSLWGCGADCTTIIALEGAPDAAAVSAAQAAEIRRIRFVREASGVSPAPYAIRLGASGNHVVAHCAFYGLAMDLYWRATGPALVYDCTFEGRGAGVGLGFDAGMIVDSCRFSRAYVGGAGVLLLRRCTFAESPLDIGESDVTVDSCLFADAGGYNAGIGLWAPCSLRMANCIMWGKSVRLIADLVLDCGS